MFEWRKVAVLTKLQLLLKVTREIVMPRKLYRRTERRVGLHEDFARPIAAPCPTCNLGKQLERPFARAEIRKMQRKIGVDDPDQRHIWEMQTLGDHLRADEDVDLAGAKIPQCLAISFFPRH